MKLQPLEADWLRQFLSRSCANELTPDKDYLFDARLRPVLRTFELRSMGHLVRELRAKPRGELADAVIDAMTTNETSFFRDRSFFAAMETEILPALIEKQSSRRTLTIWSAACSTGQEIYSVAMMLREVFPQLISWKIRLVATDVSPDALARAQSASYSSLEVGRGLSEALRRRYFRADGRQWVVDDRLRSLVEFHRMNLDGSWPVLPRADLIMIRNVLIYFNDATRRRVLDRAAGQLAPGGMLVLGAQERLPTGARLKRRSAGAYPTFGVEQSLSSLLSMGA